ncbi:2-oxoglutarate and iron-dependent oxygenase domain-containing protein 2 isoform X2 [Gadus macrocephalus]|uniref:2-oxoglutarate and iron-dependent oxygenase domain-containing protein 2 isoform X2 n=1 Tax=Gadus macrocephalus TaxID=80720 RepID=UPI0028CB54E3|nr:2-oxoglutarate and iron-dependent oxygenase domain-containing protein 2 isoform X2 [Gadus macrocephalus]
MDEGEREKQCFYTCRCYLTDNIFLEDYRLHVRYVTEQQFRADHQQVLRSRGCLTDEHFDEVLQKIAQEVERRQSLNTESAERTAEIRQVYRPRHPHLYHLQESFLAPEFLQIVAYCRSSGANQEGLLGMLQSEAAPRVFRLAVFTRTFCQELVEELEHFERSPAPKGRPNTMNNYGMLLNELGFDGGLTTPLRERYLGPIASLLYPDCGGGCLDSHKAFVVKYDLREDLDLSYHYDNAEVTLNVSLGKDFTGGNLYFGDMKDVPLGDTECSEVEHRVSAGLLHRGQQMHGALPIAAGQRWSLIIWMRASRQRNHRCPMCSQTPSLVRGEGFADGFTDGVGDEEGAQNASCVLT